jgi:hypothetical protein
VSTRFSGDVEILFNCRQLIVEQSVTESELAQLADERADNVKSAVVDIDASLRDRIRIEQSRATTRGSDEMIRMKIAISTED